MKSEKPSPTERLASRLPFDLSDARRVNDAYVAYRAAPETKAREVIELWTYCYVQHYFSAKLHRRGNHAASDFDELVDDVYRKIGKHRNDVRSVDRYANWVSVICKNTFLNYLRRRRTHVGLDRGSELEASDEGGAAAHLDTELAEAAVAAAIARLPDFLREVARLRLLEERPYEEIAERVGKPVPIIRAYVNKARRRMQADKVVEELFDRALKPT